MGPVALSWGAKRDPGSTNVKSAQQCGRQIESFLKNDAGSTCQNRPLTAFVGPLLFLQGHVGIIPDSRALGVLVWCLNPVRNEKISWKRTPKTDWQRIGRKSLATSEMLTLAWGWVDPQAAMKAFSTLRSAKRTKKVALTPFFSSKANGRGGAQSLLLRLKRKEKRKWPHGVPGEVQIEF